MLPVIRHDFSNDDWQAVARIIVKGYADEKYFPINISKAFMAISIFGEKAVTSAQLLESYLNYLPVEDSDILKRAMSKDNLNMLNEDEDVLEILSSLSSKRHASSGAQLQTLLEEIAHRDIVQTPSYIKEVWEVVFADRNFVSAVSELEAIYESAKPTTKRVLNLLTADIASNLERETFGYLKRFVRGLSKDDLGKFLRFVTGADVMCVDKIKITFTNICGLERRVVAHTCGAVMEIPVTYDSFVEFKEELLNILKSGFWNMDFV